MPSGNDSNTKTAESGGDGTVIPPIPESRQATIQAGLLMMQTVQHELDVARTENASLELRLKSAEAEIESLNRTITKQESEIVEYRMARDQAVADRAVYEVLFDQLRSNLDAAVRPALLHTPPRAAAPDTGGGGAPETGANSDGEVEQES